MIIYMNRSARAHEPAKQVEAPLEDDDYDYEPVQEKQSSRGNLGQCPTPRPPTWTLSGERRLWGATFIALAGASALNGLYVALD